MSSEFQSDQAVRDYLYSLKNHGAKYGIDRMRLVVERLGHPERQVPSVHLAGTNGKGSTAAMLEAIFRAAGLRTGLFTSPHLVFQGERVQVNRENLSHEAIRAYVNKLRPVAEAMAADDPDDHPSFFEFMTAMAFLRFAEVKADVSVIETGLGGRLDATNVLTPMVSVITSIGMDHMDLLGGTLEAIAAEKAGILKPGVPVVLGMLEPAAEGVIRARAATLDCPVFCVRERFGEDLSAYPQSALEGEYQRINAAIAVLTVEVVRNHFEIPSTAVEQGLATVQWAGRWDRREIDGRTVIFDSTHNAEGAHFLSQNLERLVASEGGRRPLIVTGTLGEARAQSLLPVAARFARELHLMHPAQPRACSFETLEEAIPAEFRKGQGLPIHRSRVRDLFPRPGVCALGAPGETIVVTGSIYLIGEIMDAVYHGSAVDEGVLQD
jgi:dihydrofolate synthase/folylpolyglutamate synthase